MLRDVMGKTFQLLGYTIQYGCIAHCAFEYLGGIVMCSGPSMEPTIQNSDIVFSENLSRHFYCIQKGDIVIAKSPNDPKSNVCKRVIGLEGDKVCTSSPSDLLKRHCYFSEDIPAYQQSVTSSTEVSPVIDDICCHRMVTPWDIFRESKYQKDFKIGKRCFMVATSPRVQPIQVPKGHVWLEGDNLRNSTDSRYYGAVPYGLIRGRICFKIWPLNDFGFLRASPNGQRFLDD